MPKYLFGVECEYKIITAGQALADAVSFKFTWRGGV
jgi:hypothetical protein